MDVFPFGILYVGSALHSAGYKVRLVHCTSEETNIHLEQILSEEPLFVGFSVMTGPQIVPSVEMSRITKKASNIPIVWGSPHSSLIPEQCLLEDYIDIVVIGEGEETAVIGYITYKLELEEAERSRWERYLIRLYKLLPGR